MTRPNDRRTYGAYHTEEEAREAAYNLARLMNGVPCGYVFCIGQRMGAWVFFSCRAEAFQ
jgi:hypothetical protein